MITELPFNANLKDIDDALTSIPLQEPGKQTINQPTGNFFYDPWKIKPQYKNTPWESLLSSLTIPHGEARVITLTSKSNYVRHSDIDDRYHLNLSGVSCYLIDLDNQVMYPTEKDGMWYKMDTSKRHTAANFGNRFRHQLVVRELLQQGNLVDPVHLKIVSKIDDLDEARFAFDHTLSSLMNINCKQGLVCDFKLTEDGPEFKIERSALIGLAESIGNELQIMYL